MHVRQVSKKVTKAKKNLKKSLNTWVFCFAAVLDIHEVKLTDIKQFIFTASLLVHLFLGCLKHLNTNKLSVAKKSNESKQQVTLQIMECEPFLPLSRVNWVTTKGTLLQLQSKVCTL